MEDEIIESGALKVPEWGCEIPYVVRRVVLGEPETQGEKFPSRSTDGTAREINQERGDAQLIRNSELHDAALTSEPEGAADVAESPVDGRKLSRQEKWRRKNKKAVAAYMKGWRARKKAGRET